MQCAKPVNKPLEEQSVSELQCTRNYEVRKWDLKMQPLRKARAEGNSVDWAEWDKLEEEMSIAVAIIDNLLFKKSTLR